MVAILNQEARRGHDVIIKKYCRWTGMLIA